MFQQSKTSTPKQMLCHVEAENWMTDGEWQYKAGEEEKLNVVVGGNWAKRESKLSGIDYNIYFKT